ncbi:non-specific serine/threonine protein kinase [Ranunculus cassubicifolius]
MNYTFVIFQRSRTLTYNVVVRQSPTRAIIWLIFGHEEAKQNLEMYYMICYFKIIIFSLVNQLRPLDSCENLTFLRLSLAGSPKSELEETCALPSKLEKTSEKYSKESSNPISSIRGPDVTPYSNPELGRPFTATEVGTSSISSSDPSISPFFIPEMNSSRDMDGSCSDTDSEEMTPSSTSLNVQPWMKQILSSSCSKLQYSDGTSQTRQANIHSSIAKTLVEKFWKLDHEASLGSLNYRQDHEYARNAPSGPPPLYSIFQHKAPVFGKPPRWFSYAELELATDGFSEANFLAEGGFGSVHRGVFKAVAVKQHKLASSQGDHEFCSEVEVLSCAQHRNVVMLIGFCVEDRRRLLVYEYICNSSLDSHLYATIRMGGTAENCSWAARGLRYLHEECRVGCMSIVICAQIIFLSPMILNHWYVTFISIKLITN